MSQMKKIVTWVLVADAGAGQVYANEGPGRGLAAVAGGTFEADPSRGQDVFSDREGRSFDRVGGGRHAMAPPTSAREQGRESFAKEMVHWLEAPARAKAFDRLALVVEPKTLGVLRDALSPATQKKVVAELAKDLTKAGAPEIARALGDQIDV